MSPSANRLLVSVLWLPLVAQAQTVEFGTPQATPSGTRTGVNVAPPGGDTRPGRQGAAAPPAVLGPAVQPNGRPCVELQRSWPNGDIELQNRCDKTVQAQVQRVCLGAMASYGRMERLVVVAPSSCLKANTGQMFSTFCQRENQTGLSKQEFIGLALPATTCSTVAQIPGAPVPGGYPGTGVPPPAPKPPPGPKPPGGSSAGNAGRPYVCFGDRELNFAGCKGRYTYLCNSSNAPVTAKVFYLDSDGPLTRTLSVTVTAPAGAEAGKGAPQLVGSSVFGHNGVCRDRSWSIALPGQ